jgi:6-phosphogluconolactonase
VTRDEVAAEAAAAFDVRVTDTLQRQARFAVAVPGGSVATALFPRLAELSLPWDRLDLTFVDERLVPVSDPESNRGAAEAQWIDRLGATRPRLIAPPVARVDPDVVAAAWQSSLVDALGSPPRLDLAILGMGSDGHVASLFPGHPLLDRRGAWTAGLTDSPKPPPARVTLTLDTLAASAEIWVVAFGREKAAAVADARDNPASQLPVAIVARAARRVQWFLDEPAASRGTQRNSEGKG